jgi:hypothetical protein
MHENILILEKGAVGEEEFAELSAVCTIEDGRNELRPETETDGTHGEDITAGMLG